MRYNRFITEVSYLEEEGGGASKQPMARIQFYDPLYSGYYSKSETTTLPVESTQQLQKELNELTNKLETAEERISEIVKKQRCITNNTFKLKYDSSANEIKIAYTDPISGMHMILPPVPISINTLDQLAGNLSNAVLAAEKEVKVHGVLNQMKDVIKFLPWIYYETKHFLVDREPAKPLVFYNHHEGKVLIVVKDNTIDDGCLQLHVDLDDSMTVEQMLKACNDGVLEAMELPKKKEQELQVRKATANESVREAQKAYEEAVITFCEPDTLMMASGNPKEIRIIPNKEYTNFSVVINNPLAKDHVTVKTTKGIEFGMGFGDGMLDDAVGLFTEQLDVLLHLEQTAQNIVSGLTGLRGPKVTIADSKEKMPDYEQLPSGEIGVQFSRDTGELLIFIHDTTSKNGKTESKN